MNIDQLKKGNEIAAKIRELSESKRLLEEAKKMHEGREGDARVELLTHPNSYNKISIPATDVLLFITIEIDRQKQRIKNLEKQFNNL